MMILQQARGALSSGDQCSLDLPFAATKSLTARIGPTPAFTRASVGTFVGSDGLIQSAGNNIARFDHDPDTLACKGLLIEDSRTNLALYSGVIVRNIGWNGNATPSVSGTGPDGNPSYQISEVAINGLQSIANGGGTGALPVTSVVSGTTYTGSIFVKKVAGSVDWVQMTFGGTGFGTSQFANFNIGNGTVGHSVGLSSGTSPRIENYGNGWYRLSISVVASATIATNNVILAFIQNTNVTARIPSYLGSPSNSVLASLCQFETGIFPTSYIPTVAASVIRSADVCNITGSDFSGIYNQSEGTLFIDATPQTVSQLSLILAFNTTGSSNSHSIWKSNSGITGVGLRRVGGTGGQSLITTTTDIATTRSKLSYAYKTNDMAFAANGSLVGTDTSGTMPTSTALRIGSRDDSIGFYLNGHIAVVRCYKKRLPNAKLQALTV